MPGLLRMRTAIPAALLLVCLPALASEADFHSAVKTGSWEGCVYEEGYPPYPITLTPRGKDFFVAYPELECVGGHSVTDTPGAYDATEVIVIDMASQCTPSAPLSYTIGPAGLRIDYFAEETGTYALLHPSRTSATPWTCTTAEAIS